MRKYLGAVFFAVIAFFAVSPQAEAQSANPPYGIDAKRPLFGGACKVCPWGILADVTRDALKPYGYDVQICYVCWSYYGPRAMADKSKPVMPVMDIVDPTVIEPPPDGILDISATNEPNLIHAYNGTGNYAKDGKQRRNYRVIAAVQQANYYLTAATKESGITSLAQIKDRAGPTFIHTDEGEATKIVLAHYGITEEGLKAKGGGLLPRETKRGDRKADVFLHHGLLVNTPEQRMWYEETQIKDLVFFGLEDALLDKLVKDVAGLERATIPLGLMRGVTQTIPGVMRTVHMIYVRDEAPEEFAYTLAKALDEQQHQFLTRMTPFHYDQKRVAVSMVVPLHPGAIRYYRERGYMK